MLYQWLYSLADQFSAFNVFRYITFRSVLSFFTAFLTCWYIGPAYIRKMMEIKMGQNVRDDGPESHKKKQGTPTMGGGLILLGTLLPLLMWFDLRNPLVIAVLVITWGFGIVGYIDDYLKVSQKNTKGLSGKLRLVCEFLISGIVVAVLVHQFSLSTVVYVPFFKKIAFELGWFYPVFASLVIVGTANAVNLTDGLDGLATVPFVVSAATLGLFAYVCGHIEIANYLQIPHVQGASELTPVVSCFVAAAIGFLWYNAYPAQIFMGDVGSLSLGGFLGTMAVLTNNEILMVILGGIFVVEALSVIIQVYYFKKTQKRFFKMAPIHHHFELKGLSETKIIVRFWIISILLAIICLSTLKLR